MSKNSQEKSANKNKKPLTGWDKAVYDAEQMIEKAKQKIAGLKLSIKTFKSLKEQGEPYPGESAQPE
jgi:hypothetical protein